MTIAARQRVIFSVVLVLFLTGFCFGQAPEAFTVVLLPDTQYYAEKYPEIYLAQTQWIKNHAEKQNIQFVLHLGDIVQDDTDERQWKAADQAHRVLDGVVPCCVLPGNHDMNEDDHNAVLYNQYFPTTRFERYPWYGGHEGATNNNNFCLFDAGGMKFLIVNLEYDPSDQTLSWAGQVIADHADRRVMVATHSYLNAAGRTPPGKRIWDGLIRKHPNIFMVHCGHICAISLQTARNDAGGLVYEMLTDYQGMPNGGNGWLRLLRFVPSENAIHVETFSPTVKPSTEYPHTYRLDYDMGVSSAKKAG